MEPPRNKGGRPKGNRWPTARAFRLNAEEIRLLRALAAAWNCSEAAAVRTMIRDTARREKVE